MSDTQGERRSTDSSEGTQLATAIAFNIRYHLVMYNMSMDDTDPQMLSGWAAEAVEKFHRSKEGVTDCKDCGAPLVCRDEELLAAWNRYNPVIESLRAQLIMHGIAPTGTQFVAPMVYEFNATTTEQAKEGNQ